MRDWGPSLDADDAEDFAALDHATRRPGVSEPRLPWPRAARLLILLSALAWAPVALLLG